MRNHRFGLTIFLMLSSLSIDAGELTITAVEPARHSFGSTPETELTIHFDRALLESSVGPSSLRAFGRWSGTVTGGYSFSNGGSSVTLTPDRPFSSGETVIVILSRDLEALDGSFLRPQGFAFQFSIRVLPAGFDFEQTQVLDTGSPSRPYGGVASDFNGDGFLDITTVNEDTDDVRVFLNRADDSGQFEDYLLPTAATGNVPSPSEPADFDGDGNIDLVVANTQASSVSVLLGNGDGTFAAQQEIGLSGFSRGVAVLDVDGDGDFDIAATSRTTGLVNILRNNGAGVFGSPTTFGTGTAEEWALAAGDMNNDGIFDLVVGGRGSSRVYVYLGDGAGGFTLADDVFCGATWMVVLGDVNGDGFLDVSTANGFSDSGSILLGDGTGQLAAPQTHAVDPIVVATDLGDVDGDGDLDWMLASFGGDWVLFENDGSGGFVFDREIDAPAAASCSLMMDIENDGDIDLALFDELANEVVVLRNRGLVFADHFESGDLTGWSATVNRAPANLDRDRLGRAQAN